MTITRPCLDCGRPTERSRCRECERKFSKTRGRQMGKARVERRKRVLAYFGNRCAALLPTGERCNIHAPLQVHHINGNPADDSAENLVPVCVEHHRSLAGAPRDAFARPETPVIG